MPALILLAPTAAYTFVRAGLALAIMVASAAWLLNCLFGIAGSFVDALETAIAIGFVPFTVLMILTTTVLLRRRVVGRHGAGSILPVRRVIGGSESLPDTSAL